MAKHPAIQACWRHLAQDSRRSSLAIVGPTGSGIHPGQPITRSMKRLKAHADRRPRSARLSSGRAERHIGMVPRRFLFSATIRENLALARPCQHESAQGAAAAHIRQEIRRIPQGFETRVGNAASAFRGQKQRAAIARALLRRRQSLFSMTRSRADTYTEERISERSACYSESANHPSYLLIASQLMPATPTRSPCSFHGKIVELAGMTRLLSLEWLTMPASTGKNNLTRRELTLQV